MASFDLAFPILLRFEGGYVDDPDDPGGETNKGITMATFRACAGSLLGLDPTSDNLKGLTDGQAAIVYRALYWNKMQGDAFALQELANIVFDYYVNAGSHATTLLQRLLNTMGASLIVDGLIGPAVLQALDHVDQNDLYRRYKQGRIQYYQALAAAHPGLARFLSGWLARVNAFPDL